MALALDTSRQLRSLSELSDLIEAIATAPSTESEPDWLEWKSQADLADRRWHARIAKFIAGFANRDPAVAKLQAGGCGYLVIGVEPGNVVGVSPVDNAVLLSGVSRFVRNTVRWSPQNIPHDGKHILVITVEPPESGDGITAILAEYTDRQGATECRKGDVFVRRSGKTERATQDDYDKLVERFAASETQASSGITVEAAEAVTAVAVACTPHEQSTWRELEERALLGPLEEPAPRQASGTLAALVQTTDFFQTPEKRTARDYRDQVASYLNEAVPLLPDLSRAEAIADIPASMRLVLVNETEHNFAEVRVEVVISGSVWAYRSEEDARPRMPTPPRLWGPVGLLDTLQTNTGVLYSPVVPGAMGGRYGPYIDNSRSARIVFDEVHLRPGTSIDLDPIYLVADVSLAGTTLLAEWEATSTSVSGIARGEIPITVSTEVVSPLSDLLES